MLFVTVAEPSKARSCTWSRKEKAERESKLYAWKSPLNLTVSLQRRV